MPRLLIGIMNVYTIYLSRTTSSRSRKMSWGLSLAAPVFSLARPHGNHQSPALPSVKGARAAGFATELWTLSLAKNTSAGDNRATKS